MQEITNFLTSFLTQVTLSNLDIAGMELDHIAYQADSSEAYDQIKNDFSVMGKLVSEELIGGRRVAIYKLDTPIVYDIYKIHALEVIEPKKDQIVESGYQHAEYVLVNESFESYMNRHDHVDWDTSSLNRKEFSHLKLNFKNGLTLKFCRQPILEAIKKG